jgi:Dyp-type peroxidase family
VSPTTKEPVLAVGEIQGNVLPGFNTRHQTLVGLRFADAGAARRWLASVVPAVATLADVHGYRVERREARLAGVAPAAVPVWVNIALDAQGLAAMGVDVANVRDGRFRQGMGEASNLGDPRDRSHPGHPSRWVVGGTPATTPHALLIVASDDEAGVDGRVAGLRRSAEEHGLTVIYEQDGHGLDGEIEHFGFRDGISSVGARGRLDRSAGSYLTRRSIDSDRFGRPGQPLVWPGQFVFGYPRQRADDPVKAGPVSKGGHAWMDNGSFLVLRRLRQDVAAFERFVEWEAGRLHDAGHTTMTSGRLAALLVGRWPKGTALMRNQAGDDPDPMADLATVNDFGFAGDRFGRVCPSFAHIRKVNPRDLSTDKGGPDRTLTFAVLRRGIPWGDPYPSSSVGRALDNGDRGLLFLCYQTSIKDQFEVLNTDWMNRRNGPEGDAGHDLLVGQGDGPNRERAADLRDAESGAAPARIATLTEWVTPTGGGYFFAPSISALRQLAAGDVG